VITGGTKAGNNLFHSFSDFNIAAMDSARFQTGLINPLPDASVSNILGRITGGPSSIFGNLNSATFYPSANLFLMNTAGFLFGPNATVNVGGMVAFTSADYLRLQDLGGGNAGIFHADSAQASVLTTAPVAAYGFLGSNPGAITVRGSQLTVTPGISLVGGNISIQSSTPDDGPVQSARLSASGGQMILASVASPGEILTGSMAPATNISGQSFGNLGAIQVTEQSVIDVSGNGGGTVMIRGGNFVLDNSTISANITGPGPATNNAESIGGGINIHVSQDAVIQNAAVLETHVASNATPGVQYGGTHVKANGIEIIGSQDFDNFPFTGIRSDISEGSTGGNSGNITLEANSILVQDLGTFTTILEATTSGAGNAGNIALNANDIINLDGATIQSLSLSSPGNAGNISFSSAHGDIVVANGTFIINDSISGSGNTGTISLNAQRNISMTGPIGSLIATDSLSGSGNAGNISLTSKDGDILLTNGPLILSTTFSSTGTAGNILMNALAGDVLIAGGDFSGSVGTSLRPPAGQNPSAPGSGAIEVNAINLTIHNTAISSDNLFSPVKPGNITINLSGTLNLSGTFTDANGALIHSLLQTTSRGPAPSADINIIAHDVQVSEGARISTEAFSSGNAGSITILTENLDVTGGGQVRSGSVVEPGFPISPSGAGGTITVQGSSGPTASVLVDGTDSGFFTNTEGTGAGGDIHLSANSVTLQNGGALSAATTGVASSATGGSITVNAEHVAVNTQGVITADTNGIAPAGVVDINTGTLAINSGGQIRSSSGAETEQVSALAFSSTAAPSLTGGTISIQGQNGNDSVADSVTIDGSGSGVFTESTGSRPGGDINILTSQSVAMTNGAGISASSTGTGNAGSIQISAGSLFGMANSKVTTEANNASGGTIKITTTPAGTVEMTNSTITASVLDGTGGGGSVDIDPQFVILQNSQILADAVFGPGGNINITTNLLLPDTTSIIRASSQFGQQGTIVIQSPVSPASGKLVPLGQKPLIATALLSQRCAALAGGNASSFTVAGRDSLPAEPGGWMSIPLALSMGEPDDGMAREARDVREETNPYISLRKIAPIGFLTQSFALDSSDCHS
jgi:filamentous hemagglutinin family protein